MALREEAFVGFCAKEKSRNVSWETSLSLCFVCIISYG